MFRAKVQSVSRELGPGSVLRALAISLLLHFLVIGGVEIGRSAGFWRVSLLPALSQSPAIEEVVADAQRREELRKQQEQTPEAELVFMDVDPAQAVPEPPKDAKYYSAQNTLAANPSPKLDLKDPEIDGKQERILKTMDTMRPDPRSMQPAPQPAPSEEPEPKPEAATPQDQPAPERPPQEEQPELKPEGDMLIARAAPRPQPKAEAVPRAEPPRTRPRTIAEARAQKGILDGPRMKQAGGARRHALDPGLDVRATPFGAYDAAFIAAVQNRWFGLLDERDFVGNQSGKVVVEFDLNLNGRITAMRVVESEVSETLSWICQRAVLDPAPYRPFPPDLRRMLQRDFRPVRFTFYYNQ